jgi:hypothetical protein
MNGLMEGTARSLEPGQDTFTRAEVAMILGVKPESINPLVRRHGLAAEGNGKARRYPRQTVEAILERQARGMGASTVGYYAREIKAFTKWLATGATPKQAMHLARHSDPKLTMKRYGKPQLHDLRAAVEQFPSLLSVAPDSEPETMRATGTDGRACASLRRGWDSAGLSESGRDGGGWNGWERRPASNP